MNLKKIILSTIAVVSLASASDVKVSDYKLMEKEYEKVLGNGSYLMDYYKGQNKNFIRIADANRRAITNMVHYTSDNSFAMFMEGAGMFFDGGKNPVELSINPEFKKTIDELVSFKVGSGAENIYIVTDPECPYCKKYEASLKPLKELESSYTINYIFLPLESLGHNKARSMSQYFMLADDPKVSHERMNKVMVRNDLTEYKDFMYKINSLKKKEKLESEDKSLLEKWESAGERIRKGENITKQTNKLIKSEIKTNSEVKVTRITKETKKKNIEIIRPTVPKGTSGSEVIMLNKPINFIVKSKSASYHDNPSPHKRKDLIGKDKTVIGVGFNKYGWVLLDNKKWVKGYILEPRLYPIQE
jgi:glutaredoxin